MVKFFILFLFVCCSSGPFRKMDKNLDSSPVNDSYKLDYSMYWGEVVKSIESNWKSSLVPASKNLPYEFLSIASGRSIIFYWDSYFTNIGLFYHDSVSHLALNSTKNLLHEISLYGYVPNSSESWGLNRSQPPYLSMMVRDVFEKFNQDTVWLKEAYYFLLKEYNFWTEDNETAIEKNNTNIPGLQRYYHHASNEELIELFHHIHKRGLIKHIKDIHALSEDDIVKLAIPFAAEAESGMDFTPRFENRCPDFVALDLNCNLYIYEKNFAWMQSMLNLQNQPDWVDIASKRKDLIQTWCWSEKDGLFMDYDFVNQRHSKVPAITTFAALYAKIATPDQAERMVNNLDLFEHDWGVSICPQTNQDRYYQWDYPAGWPPMFFITVQGLDNYGYKKEALRIATKYLNLVVKNFVDPVPERYTDRTGAESTRKPGYVYEKYTVDNGIINDNEYASRPFMGWSTGVYVWMYNYVIRNN